jgi:hypothetical protein
MSIAALIPVAGAAVSAVTTTAGLALDHGLAFLNELTGQGTAASEAEPTSATDGSSPEKLNPLEKQFSSRLKQFEDEFRRRLRAMGITGDVALQLGEQSWGTVGVEGEHPQKEAIDSLFASDPLLASQYHSLAQDYRQLQGGSGDVSEYTRRDTFTLTVSGNEAIPALQPR